MDVCFTVNSDEHIHTIYTQYVSERISVWTYRSFPFQQENSSLHGSSIVDDSDEDPDYDPKHHGTVLNI